MTGGTKSTIDMALSTAMCGSFAIPEVGVLVAAGIAGGQFMFDVFYPAENSADPADLPASRADIDLSLIHI